MAALTFTAASVLLSGGLEQPMIAGGTVARGNVLRINTSNQVVTAANDSATNAAAYGIALSDCSSGQKAQVAVLTSGGILAGVATNGAVGKVVVLGTSGAILPVDDIAGGEFVTVLGVCVTASTIQLGVIKGGVAAAGAVS